MNSPSSKSSSECSELKLANIRNISREPFNLIRCFYKAADPDIRPSSSGKLPIRRRDVKFVHIKVVPQVLHLETKIHRIFIL